MNPLFEPFQVPADTTFQGHSIRDWCVAANMLVCAISAESRKALQKQLSQVQRGKRPIPEMNSRLGLFWLHTTSPGIRARDEDEGLAVMPLVVPHLTQAERQRMGLKHFDNKPRKIVPLERLRDCGNCCMCCELHREDGHPGACPNIQDGRCGIYETRPASCRRFECAWRAGYDIPHPSDLHAMVVVGSMEDGHHRVHIFRLPECRQSDDELSLAIMGLTMQMAPVPCEICIHHLGTKP